LPKHCPPLLPLEPEPLLMPVDALDVELVPLVEPTEPAPEVDVEAVLPELLAVLLSVVVDDEDDDDELLAAAVLPITWPLVPPPLTWPRVVPVEASLPLLPLPVAWCDAGAGPPQPSIRSPVAIAIASVVRMPMFRLGPTKKARTLRNVKANDQVGDC
jgi:hypothetical protein